MEQLSLFDSDRSLQPLASRLRPVSLEEFVGQRHLLGPGKVLKRMIDEDRICSMIFWGPPGVGKTTLARIIARMLMCHKVTHKNLIDNRLLFRNLDDEIYCTISTNIFQNH